MFWQVANYSQPSPVEALLDKQDCSLEELLDEDDVIQEAKSLNGRLVYFLKQPDTVYQLLALIVEPAGEGNARITGHALSLVEDSLRGAKGNL